MAYEKNIIKRYRLRKGLTQTELATKLGFQNGQYISNVERDLCLFSFKRYLDLQRVLGIPVHVFLDYVMAHEKQRILRGMRGAEKAD